MNRLRTLGVALGLVSLVVVAQAGLVALLGWLIVAPVSFAGEPLSETPGARPVVTLHVGPLLLAGGAMAARIAGDLPVPLTALRGADVEVYELDGDFDASPATILRAPAEGGWVPVVRVRDDEDLVGIFARVDGQRIEALRVVVTDGEDLVRVHLSGHLERAAATLFRWAIEQAGAEGWIREGVAPAPPTPPTP